MVLFSSRKFYYALHCKMCTISAHFFLLPLEGDKSCTSKLFHDADQDTNLAGWFDYSPTISTNQRSVFVFFCSHIVCFIVTVNSIQVDLSSNVSEFPNSPSFQFLSFVIVVCSLILVQNQQFPSFLEFVFIILFLLLSSLG